MPSREVITGVSAWNPDVIKHVAGLLAGPDGARLVVDAIGVGSPVVDSVREAGLEPVAMTLTAGKHVRRVEGTWRVPKRVLVGLLVTAFESGRLKVAAGLPCGEALVPELR
jgi:hypothetical protein